MDLGVDAAYRKISTNAKQPKRIILILIDGNIATERAFFWYLKNLSRSDDFVNLLTVIEPDLATGQVKGSKIDLDADDLKLAMKNKVEASQALGQRYSIQLTTAQINHKFQYIVGAPAKEMIISYLRDREVHLIVLGSRGSTEREPKTQLGKVSNHIVHHAHVPVCIVPPDV